MGNPPDDANTVLSLEVVSGDNRYRKAPYSPPEKGTLYAVRDKAGKERVVQVTDTSPDGALVQVVTLEDGRPSKQSVQIAVDSLARQAGKGWCSLLLPVSESEEAPAAASHPATSDSGTNVTMRLDIQNFSRCIADIVRANIKFDTQLIKDVGEGPFRAGNYAQAFLTFEQCTVGFTSAVANSRRADRRWAPGPNGGEGKTERQRDPRADGGICPQRTADQCG